VRALVISGRLIRFKSNTGINKERSLEVTEGEGKSGRLLFLRLLLFAFFAGPIIWVTGVLTRAKLFYRLPSPKSFTSMTTGNVRSSFGAGQC